MPNAARAANGSGSDPSNEMRLPDETPVMPGFSFCGGSSMETTFSGNEIVGGVLMNLVTVWAFAVANLCAGNKCVGALAGNTGLYRKSLETSFAFH